MAHLSCVGETREGLRLDPRALRRDRDRERARAARRPAARARRASTPPEDGLSSAAELTGFIGERHAFSIGGACFPEVHPEADDLDSDLAYLKTKVDAGATFLITQLFFDNARYFDFVAAAREIGIDVPIIPGVIPITSFGQVARICDALRRDDPRRARVGDAGARRRRGGRGAARRRLRGPAVRGAARRRGPGHPLLRAQPRPGDPGGARRAAGLATLGARRAAPSRPEPRH